LIIKKRQLLDNTKEVYDRGNGAAILLYTIIDKKMLTRQFRLPTYLNGNKKLSLIEVCIGVDQTNLNNASLEKRRKRQVIALTKFKKLMEAYMSPGFFNRNIVSLLSEYNESKK
jgi:hypothetical protein